MKSSLDFFYQTGPVKSLFLFHNGKPGIRQGKYPAASCRLNEKCRNTLHNLLLVFDSQHLPHIAEPLNLNACNAKILVFFNIRTHHFMKSQGIVHPKNLISVIRRIFQGEINQKHGYSNCKLGHHKIGKINL